MNRKPLTPNGPADPDSLERRARMMRRVNVVMRVALRLPFRTPLSSRLLLVTHIGRRTGRPIGSR
jgi:hypothetical protein